MNTRAVKNYLETTVPVFSAATTGTTLFGFDEIGSSLPDHDADGVRIARYEGWHNRCVSDTHSLNATNPELRIDDGVVVGTHTARAGRVQGRVRRSQAKAQTSLYLSPA